MADRNIVTQVGIENLKFALSEVAENLSAHVNASLSKAHGINIVNGYIDDAGNNLTTYRDSIGSFVGTYFLEFVVDNVRYYAPAILTTLSGQGDSTGIVDSSEEGEFEAQGGSVWVTDYTSDQVSQAQAMNTDVLIPHTRQPHWSTHGSMTVLAQPTYNTLGNQIGTHVVQIRYDGALYNIPVSNRFGGPAQRPTLSGILSNFSITFPPGSGTNTNLNVLLTLLGGTLPVRYHWQCNIAGVWTDITPAPVGFFQIPGWDTNAVYYEWADTSTANFFILNLNPGSNQTRSAQFRCRVTNEAVPNTGATSGVFTNILTATATDET